MGLFGKEKGRRGSSPPRGFEGVSSTLERGLEKLSAHYKYFYKKLNRAEGFLEKGDTTGFKNMIGKAMRALSEFRMDLGDITVGPAKALVKRADILITDALVKLRDDASEKPLKRVKYKTLIDAEENVNKAMRSIIKNGNDFLNKKHQWGETPKRAEVEIRKFIVRYKKIHSKYALDRSKEDD